MNENEQSPVLTKIAENYDKPVKVNLDDLAKQSGIDTEAIKADVEKEVQGELPQSPAPAAPPASEMDPAKPEPGLTQKPLAQAAMGTKKDLQKGAMQGAAKLAQGLFNGAISGLDAVENFAAELGMGSGDLLSEANHIDWADKLKRKDDSIMVNVSRELTKVALPMLAVGPEKFVASVLFNGGINFAIADKHEERFSNMILKVPQLRNAPAIYDAVDWLAHKPGETDLEARFKAGLEGMGLTAAVSGIFHGTAKTVSMIKQAKLAQNTMEGGDDISKAWMQVDGIGDKADDVTKPGAQVTKSADDVTKTPEIPDALKPSTPENVVPISSHPNYNYNPTIKGSDGVERVNLGNTDVVDGLKNAHDQGAVSFEDILHVPKSRAERDAKAMALANDPEFHKRIKGWRRGDNPLTDEETKALQYMSKDGLEDLNEAHRALVADPSPENMKHFEDRLATIEHLLVLEDGTGSAASITLDANKAIADVTKVTPEQFVASQTETQRKRLMREVIKSTGGPEASMERARKLTAIMSLDDNGIERLVAIMASARGSKYKRFNNAFNQVAINGMLSSLKTTVGNHLSNSGTFIKGISDAYAGAAVGGAKNLVKEGASALEEALPSKGTQWLAGLVGKPADTITFSQANAQLSGSVESMKEAFFAMGQALRHGKGGPANIIKADILDTAGALSSKALMPKTISQSDPYFDGLMALAEEYGLQAASPLKSKVMGAMDMVDTAVSMPSRLNATADSFWGTMIYRGKIKAMATAEAEKLGLAGDDFKKFVQEYQAAPSMEVHEMARAQAMESTFSQGLVPGSTAQAVDNVFGTMPLGRVLFPFFKTQSNIVKYTVKNTPLGIFHPEVRNAVMAGGKEGDLALAKMGTGSMLIGLFAYEAATGGMTGPDTRNPQMKQALHENGAEFVPFALKRADGSILDLHRVQPLNSLMALGSAMATISGHLPAEEYQNAWMAAASHLAAVLTPEMMMDNWGDYMKAAANLGQAASEPNRPNLGEATRSAQNIMVNKVGQGMMPFGGLIRDVKGIQDPIKRNADVAKSLDSFVQRLTNRYSSQVPWLSDDLPPMRNMFGEKIMVPAGVGPDIMSPVAHSKPGQAQELTKMLHKLGGFYEDHRGLDPDIMPMTINMPPKSFQVGGVKIELTPQEYDKFVLYSAGLDPKTEKPAAGIQPLSKTLSNVMKQIAPMFEGQMTPKQYKQVTGMLNGVMNEYRNIGKMMMQRDPEIMARWTKAYQAQNTMKQLPGLKE